MKRKEKHWPISDGSHIDDFVWSWLLCYYLYGDRDREKKNNKNRENIAGRFGFPYGCQSNMLYSRARQPMDAYILISVVILLLLLFIIIVLL